MTPASRTESAAAVAEVAGYGDLALTLGLVEERLHEVVAARPGILSEAAAHLLDAGGKRVRPALAALFASLAGGADPANPAVVDAATACELVHLGSLYHDDVVDEAGTRRGVPTVNTHWSNTVAVLAGDYLLAQASQLAAGLGAGPAEVLAWTIGRLVEGEVLELSHLHDHDCTTGVYMDVIAGKTASLMGSACKLGAMVAGGSGAAVASAQEYGNELGTVFQIVDDVLDLVGDEKQTGKRRGVDLCEGVYTLPTLVALGHDPDDTLRKLLVAAPSEEQVEAAIVCIVGSGGVEFAIDVAAERLARCDALLGLFPDAPARGALQRLSRYVVDRVR